MRTIKSMMGSSSGIILTRTKMHLMDTACSWMVPNLLRFFHTILGANADAEWLNVVDNVESS